MAELETREVVVARDDIEKNVVVAKKAGERHFYLSVSIYYDGTQTRARLLRYSSLHSNCYQELWAGAGYELASALSRRVDVEKHLFELDLEEARQSVVIKGDECTS